MNAHRPGTDAPAASPGRDAERTRNAWLAHTRQELLAPASAIREVAAMLLLNADERGPEAFVADLRKIYAAADRLLVPLSGEGAARLDETPAIPNAPISRRTRKACVDIAEAESCLTFLYRIHSKNPFACIRLRCLCTRGRNLGFSAVISVTSERALMGASLAPFDRRGNEPPSERKQLSTLADIPHGVLAVIDCGQDVCRNELDLSPMILCMALYGRRGQGGGSIR
jgi:hypothetical protein